MKNKFEMGRLVKHDKMWKRVIGIIFNPYKMAYEYKLGGFTRWVDEDDITEK
jgi:hypothetical protein